MCIQVTLHQLAHPLLCQTRTPNTANCPSECVYECFIIFLWLREDLNIFLFYSGSQTEGVERVTSQETSQLSDPVGVNLNPESGVADFPDNKLDLSAEKEGEDSNADEALRSSASLAIPNISVHIKSLRPTLSPPGQVGTANHTMSVPLCC